MRQNGALCSNGLKAILDTSVGNLGYDQITHKVLFDWFNFRNTEFHVIPKTEFRSIFRLR